MESGGSSASIPSIHRSSSSAELAPSSPKAARRSCASVERLHGVATALPTSNSARLHRAELLNEARQRVVERHALLAGQRRHRLAILRVRPRDADARVELVRAAQRLEDGVVLRRRSALKSIEVPSSPVRV